MATLLKAAAGTGKTEAVLKRLLRLLDERTDTFPRVWVLLATRRQEDAFRQRLTDALGTERGAIFNVELYNFYDLNARLLAMAKRPARRLSDPLRTSLLRLVTGWLVERQQLQMFSRIALTAGFIRNLGRFIYELKQNLVDDEAFKRVAERTLKPRDADLAIIYATYQTLLRDNDLVDREGEAWLALDTVRAGIFGLQSVDLLIVDGYDQFNRVQAALLAALDQAVPEMLITLTDAGNSTIGARFQEAGQALQHAFAEAERPLAIAWLPAEPDRVPDDLSVLTHALAGQPVTAVPLTAVRWLEAPDPRAETAAVLRAVKGLLLDGVRADDILIAVRDWNLYGVPFLSLQANYDVPLSVHYRTALSSNPAVAALLQVLRLAHGLGRMPFAWRDVLDALQSPYLAADFSAEEIQWLAALAIRYQVVGHANLWQSALQQAALSRRREDDTDEPPLLGGEQAAHLWQRLSAWFALVTPPLTGTTSGYVAWVEALLGVDPLRSEAADEGSRPVPSLNMIAMVRGMTGDERLIARDLAALVSLKQVLRGFLGNEALATTLLGQAAETPALLSWPEFMEMLQIAVGNASDSARPARRDACVLATSAADARGLPHRHVFIMGLAESVFPAVVAADPFYLETERAQMRDWNIPLQSATQRAGDEGIFYELVSQARASLTFSRPATDNGKPWEPSYYWQQTRYPFAAADLQVATLTLRVGDTIPTALVANRSEALVTLAAADSASLHLPALETWVQAHAQEQWAAIQHGIRVETSRLTSPDFDRYSGQISDETLRAEISQLVLNRTYSPSQFKELALCGYYWFAHRLLRLEEREEPTLGMDHAIRGSLYHLLLEQIYTRVRDLNLLIAPEHREQALDIVQQIANATFREAPQRFGFRPDALWQQERAAMLDTVSALVTADFSGSAGLPAGRRPLYLEWDFRGDTTSLWLNDAPYAVRGMIDRVDVYEVAGQPHYVLIDYKSSKASVPEKGVAKHTSFQMLCYLTGLQAGLATGSAPIQGSFWVIREPEKLTSLALTGDAAALMSENQQVLAQLVARASAGDFGVWHNHGDNEQGRCDNFCPYYQLCRIATTRKVRPDAEETE